MIRDYEKGDELRLNPNEFSEVTDDMREIFANDRFVKHTLEDDGEITEDEKFQLKEKMENKVKEANDEIKKTMEEKQEKLKQ